LPIEIGLQTDTGYPTRASSITSRRASTSPPARFAVRGILPNPDRVLLPGFFVRVRVPFDEQKDALLVPDAALGSDQAGRYVLVVNATTSSSRRKVQTGPARRAAARPSKAA